MIFLFLFLAKVGQAKSSLHGHYMIMVHASMVNLLLSIWRLFPASLLRVSSLDMKKGHLQVLFSVKRVALRKPRVVHFFWMKLAICPWKPKPVCCAFYSRGNLRPLAAASRLKPMCGSLPPRTKIYVSLLKKDYFEKTYSSA